MKKFAKLTGVVVLTTAMTSLPIMAAENNGSVSIKFSGEMKWTATCTFMKANGKERTIKRSGRGASSIQSLAMRNVDNGSCEVSVPEDTSLKITFNSKGTIACPFGSDDPCVRMIAADGTKVFRF